MTLPQAQPAPPEQRAIALCRLMAAQPRHLGGPIFKEARAIVAALDAGEPLQKMMREL